MKRVFSLLLVCALLLSFAPAALADEAPAVVVSSQALSVDGVTVPCAAYNIDGSNYFKLRDLAMVLSGTAAQFGVVYDAENSLIRLERGSAYEPVGGELAAVGAPGQVVKGAQSLRMEGANLGFTAYNIDGYNYFKLCDLGEALGFYVGYNEVSRTMLVGSWGAEEQVYIQNLLNLKNNPAQSWSYNEAADAWTLAPVCAVAFPQLPDQQGVSVCVPGAYVKGIDTNGDGQPDATGGSDVIGSLVIDCDATVTSTNGQVYTAATAPIILNTGAAGYGSSRTGTAGSGYAAEGYINVSCGNRGKQDSLTADDGTVTYTGDAPCCLVDQKNAARFVKYNILLGNLPGNVDYLVSTGGSGGGAHAAMFAATSNNPAFYDYEQAAGAVGVYKTEDDTWCTTVTIDGTDYDISDGAWGCIAYSAITSLYEADMAMAFEYFMDVDYSFNTPFQKQLAEYLSQEYMDFINAKNWSVAESAVGFDLNGDGDQDDTIALSIQYDPAGHPDTSGYYGTYLELWLAEFQSNLQQYVEKLAYAEGWTWFDETGAPLSDAAVAAMTAQDRTDAFLAGRYAKASGMGMGPGMGGPPDMMGPPPDMMGGPPDMMGPPPDMMGGPPDMMGSPPDMMGGPVGTPDAGTTQASGTAANARSYDSFQALVEAYQADIAEVEAGDRFGKNIVELYNPGNFIGAEGTDGPVWSRVVMGGREGDMPMMASLNMQIAWLNAGTDAVIEWQWDGGHVPSEILGDSFALYVDMMYGKHVSGAVQIEKAAPAPITANGDAEEATGKDLRSWVSCENGQVSFTLAAAAAYRTSGAAKATPGFDVMDYGQEDYVFGSAAKDARHWDRFVLEAFLAHADTLAPLF